MYWSFRVKDCQHISGAQVVFTFSKHRLYSSDQVRCTFFLIRLCIGYSKIACLKDILGNKVIYSEIVLLVHVFLVPESLLLL